MGVLKRYILDTKDLVQILQEDQERERKRCRISPCTPCTARLIRAGLFLGMTGKLRNNTTKSLCEDLIDDKFWQFLAQSHENFFTLT